MKSQPIMLILMQLLMVIAYTSLYTLLQWNSGNGYAEVVLLAIGLIIGIIGALADEWYLASLYSEPGKPAHPISRSVVVLLALIPLGIYVLTSTASALAVGFYFGFATTLVSELWLLRNSPDRINQRFLWQLTQSADPIAVRKIVIAAVSVQLLFTALFLW